MSKLQTNWAFLTSTTLSYLRPEDVPSLKSVCVGGEPIRSSQIEQWASKVHLRQTYGSAETSAMVSSAQLNEQSSTAFVGKATTGSSWIVNPENLNELMPLGCPGEVIIEGAVLGREYVGEPIKTSAAFIQLPRWRVRFGPCKAGTRFYRTGDVAMFRSDGSIELPGRKDMQVKLRGQRIELGEIEHRVRLSTPYVKDVAVELATLEGTGSAEQGLLAFLVLKSNSGELRDGCDEDAGCEKGVMQTIQEELERTLPRYMVPSVLVPLPELPRTASGKTDLRRLREMGGALSAQQLAALRTAAASGAGEKRQPRTEVERRLREVWARVLDVEAEHTLPNLMRGTYGQALLSEFFDVELHVVQGWIEAKRYPAEPQGHDLVLDMDDAGQLRLIGYSSDPSTTVEDLMLTETGRVLVRPQLTEDSMRR